MTITLNAVYSLHMHNALSSASFRFSLAHYVGSDRVRGATSMLPAIGKVGLLALALR